MPTKEEGIGNNGQKEEKGLSNRLTKNSYCFKYSLHLSGLHMCYVEFSGKIT